MDKELSEFNREICEAANRHGLIFVNGPDTFAQTPPVSNINYANGQMRGQYHFAVAEVRP
jgi:hypothetical protein